MKTVRVLLYAVNGLGLGHITRLLAIAKYMRRYILVMGKQPEIMFLSTSEVDTLPFLFDFPVVKIPSKTIIEKGGMSRQQYQKMAKMMIWNCISSYNPDILAVDTFPSGSFDELYDVMDFGFQKVFVYRPRKDKDKLWKNPILRAYDRILYIDEAHEQYETSKEEIMMEDKIHHLGAIVQRDKTELLSREAACQYLGLDPKQKTACILAGGGGDSYNQDFFERMIKLMSQFKDIQVVIAAGPLYKGAEISTPQGRWFYRPDISQYWYAFDFVISAGGFNSVNELLCAQIPTLFFAQTRLYDNQEARINSLSDKGLCLYFSIDNSDEEIQQHIKKIADPKKQKSLRKQLAKYDLTNEAGNAALAILGLVCSENSLEKAEDLLEMSFLKKFAEKGLDERIVCKCIYAMTMFQDKINSMPDKEMDYIDNEDLLMAVEIYLNHVSLIGLPKNLIITNLFNSIKIEENNSLEILLEYFKK